MTPVSSIPTSRVSDAFIRERLLGQVRFSQLALFRLQNAISTGRRIELPSEDAPAALRGSALQTLLVGGLAAAVLERASRSMRRR